MGPRLCVARPDDNIGRDKRNEPRRSSCQGGVRAAKRGELADEIPSRSVSLRKLSRRRLRFTRSVGAAADGGPLRRPRPDPMYRLAPPVSEVRKFASISSLIVPTDRALASLCQSSLQTEATGGVLLIIRFLYPRSSKSIVFGRKNCGNSRAPPQSVLSPTDG